MSEFNIQPGTTVGELITHLQKLSPDSVLHFSGKAVDYFIEDHGLIPCGCVRGGDTDTYIEVYGDDGFVCQSCEKSFLFDDGNPGFSYELRENGRLEYYAWCKNCASKAKAEHGDKNFANWHIGEKDFANQDLTGADFTGASIYKTNFSGADLTDADFTGAEIGRTGFAGAKLHRTKFDNAEIHADFIGVDALNPSFANATGKVLVAESGDIDDFGRAEHQEIIPVAEYLDYLNKQGRP